MLRIEQGREGSSLPGIRGPAHHRLPRREQCQSPTCHDLWAVNGILPRCRLGLHSPYAVGHGWLLNLIQLYKKLELSRREVLV